MTNRIKKLFLGGIIMVVLLSCGTVIAMKFDKPVNTMLEILEKEKAQYVKEGKNVPNELEQKIIGQKQKELDLIATEEERQKFIEKEKKAPKDEKGNPILSDKKPIKKGFESFPQNEQVITIVNSKDGDGRPSTVFGHEIAITSIITTMANCNYNIIAAGCRKENEDIGVIYNKIYSNTEFEVNYEQYEYPEKGILTLKSYEDDNNILTFSYENGEEGYFDVRTKTAVFEKYNKN